jgi:hypothetical protein
MPTSLITGGTSNFFWEFCPVRSRRFIASPKIGDKSPTTNGQFSLLVVSGMERSGFPETTIHSNKGHFMKAKNCFNFTGSRLKRSDSRRYRLVNVQYDPY